MYDSTRYTTKPVSQCPALYDCAKRGDRNGSRNLFDPDDAFGRLRRQDEAFVQYLRGKIKLSGGRACPYIHLMELNIPPATASKDAS
jgi:hypothetical protein